MGPLAVHRVHVREPPAPFRGWLLPNCVCTSTHRAPQLVLPEPLEPLVLLFRHINARQCNVLPHHSMARVVVDDEARRDVDRGPLSLWPSAHGTVLLAEVLEGRVLVQVEGLDPGHHHVLEHGCDLRRHGAVCVVPLHRLHTDVHVACRDIIAEEYKEVQLCDADGQLCGCVKYIKGPVLSTHCSIHGPQKPKAGCRPFVAAMRRAGYRGKVVTELPYWSRMQQGHRQGRKQSGAQGGQLQSGPDMRFDVTVEEFAGALHCKVPTGHKTDAVVAVELCGSEHRYRSKTRKRDTTKFDAAPFHVLHVDFDSKHVPADDDEFWDEEAEKVMSRW